MAWTISNLITALKKTEIEVRHDHIEPGEDISEYICWYSDDSSNFMADGAVYVAIPTFYVELVEQGGRKPSREDILKNVLKENGIAYNVSASGWNQEEDAYIVVYTFQLVMED